MNEKLDIGGVFRRVFEAYRSQLGLLLPAALIIFVPLALLSGLVRDSDSIFAALATGAIAAVGTYWFQGMVVEATRDILDGRRDHTLGSLFKSVAPVLLPLVVAGILAGVGIAIGFVLLIAPGLFLATIWAVIAPVIVIERTGAVGAFGRSRALVRGHGWQVFGVVVTLLLAQFVLSAILAGIFDAISDSLAMRSLGDLIVHVVVAPISALAAAVLYFELKRLKGEQLPVGGSYQPGEAATQPAYAQAPEAPVAPAAGSAAPGESSEGAFPAGGVGAPPPAGSPGAPPAPTGTPAPGPAPPPPEAGPQAPPPER